MRRVMWCIRLAATGTESLARNPVITNVEWAWTGCCKDCREG